MPSVTGLTLTVNQTSPACITGDSYYSTIQSAVNDANAGDLIYVCNGTYTENVNINKSVNITGVNGSSKTIVNASNSGDHVFHITANSVNISGFTVRGATTEHIAGIFLDASNDSLVFNNNVTENYNGIRLNSVVGSRIENNSIWNSTFLGIHIYTSSSFNTISNNAIQSGGFGISNDGSFNNVIKDNDVNSGITGIWLYGSNWTNTTSDNNTVSDNRIYGSQWHGIMLRNSSKNNTISNNTVSSNAQFGITLEDSNSNVVKNNTLHSNPTGIILSTADNNNVTSNTLYNNSDQAIALETSKKNYLYNNNVSFNAGEGFLIMGGCNNNTISNNIIASNGQGGGIALCGAAPCSSSGVPINFNTISNNTITNNTQGISLLNSSNNTITNNTITLSTYWSIFLNSSSSNAVYHNNIINNTNQAFDDGSNTWDNGYPSGGNYWSDWTSPDSNGDGVVDYLYSIAGGKNEDRYPLTKENGWLNVTPLSTEPPVTTIITDNVTANQTKIIDARNQTNAYIEMLPETNSSFNITVGTATSTSSVNATSMTSAYGIAQNQKSLDEFVKIELSGEKINSTANLSWVYIRVYYTDDDLDKSGDGDADDPGDVNENALKLYWYWPEGNQWMPVNTGNGLVSKGGPVVYDTDTNKTENYIWANLSHFSVYGIAGDVVPEPAPTPSGGGGGVSKPKIIILANSIDYNLSGNFTTFLKGYRIDIVYTNATNFSQYNTNKFIVILGGPDAYEGVGEIVKEVLNESEQDYLRIKGKRNMYVKTNVWKSYSQVVMVIAGSDREETQRVCEEEKLEVKKKVKGS